MLRIARNAGLIALFIVAALLGSVGGALFAFSGDIPAISALDTYQPNTITRLLARDERVIAPSAAVEGEVGLGGAEHEHQVGGGVVGEEVAPWLDLVRKLGLLIGALSTELPSSLAVQVRGELASDEAAVGS